MYEKVKGKHYSVVDFKIIYEKSKTYINPIKPQEGWLYLSPARKTFNSSKTVNTANTKLSSF